MDLHCPDCGLPIPVADIAPAAGLVVCRSCDKSFSLEASKVAVPISERDHPLPVAPPAGVQAEEGMGGFTLTLSTRSAAAFFLVPFMLVWSGGSLGGIYGSQIYKGAFDPTLSLFGIPFVLGTLVFGSLALMALCGKHRLEVQGDALLHRIGFLGIYWTRRRRWSDFERAEINETTSRTRRGGYHVQNQILLKGPSQEYTCCTGVSRERLAWAVKYLNAKLVSGI